MEERLQKYLAECGVASRRKCEELILQGKVKVNNQIVTELGVKVNPEKDIVKFEDKEVKPTSKMVYILLNKPIGYVTTADDQFGRDTVLDLVKVKERIVPVGRLDMYTSGALILTNDGDFVYKVTHPKHEIEKTYTVTVKGIIKNEEVEQLRKGVKIDDYITKPAKVKILKTDIEKNISRLEIVIHEGKNRQVRKMCESVGRKVLALHRSKIGKIGLKSKETTTQPEEITQEEKLMPEIEITQDDIDVTKETQLNIFNNEKFNREKIIDPGSKGEVQICIRNKSNYDVSYDFNFTDEMQYHVNMKYKLKLDNVYIKGNKEEYKKLEDIKLKEVIVPKDSANIYTLEWYWEDDDKNDTIVGSQQDKQYYKLNLEINARQYVK